MIMPDLPDEGMIKEEALKKRYGVSPEKWHAIKSHVIEAGTEVGVTIDAMKFMYPVIDALRLMEYAKRFGLENEVVKAIFYAFFTESQPINNLDVLEHIGLKCGVPGVRAFLESDELRADVEDKDKVFKAEGVNGVPYFIVNNSIKFSGAQPEELWHQLFNQVLGKDVVVPTNNTEAVDEALS
eukprot:GFYU01001037.1.p1 GENE.GFYU01001037.1~~GFYU01001037.1.p1  ORF type:complete len:183 (-),score=40.32 GFYU01001037.1:298-846(-)